jgi:hypothetical protein
VREKIKVEVNDNTDLLLFDNNPKKIQTVIKGYVDYQYDRGLSPITVRGHYMALKHFYESNEIVFQEISNDIEKGPNLILDKIRRGELNIPIDPTALKQYVVGKFSDLTNITPRYGVTGTERILEELNSLGIRTLADLDARVNSKIRVAYQKQGKYSGINENITALVRHILMSNDAKSYFEKAWNNHFHTIDPTSLELLQDSGADTNEILKHLEISTKGFG